MNKKYVLFALSFLWSNLCLSMEGDFPKELFDLSAAIPSYAPRVPNWQIEREGGQTLRRTYFSWTPMRNAFEAGRIIERDSCQPPFNAFVKRLQEHFNAPVTWCDLVPFLEFDKKIIIDDQELNLTEEYFALASVPYFWGIDELGRLFIAFASVEDTSIDGLAGNTVAIDYYIRETTYPCRWRNSRGHDVTEKDFQKLADLIYFTMPVSEGGCLHCSNGTYVRLQMPKKI